MNEYIESPWVKELNEALKNTEFNFKMVSYEFGPHAYKVIFYRGTDLNLSYSAKINNQLYTDYFNDVLTNRYIQIIYTEDSYDSFYKAYGDELNSKYSEFVNWIEKYKPIETVAIEALKNFHGYMRDMSLLRSMINFEYSKIQDKKENN